MHRSRHAMASRPCLKALLVGESTCHFWEMAGEAARHVARTSFGSFGSTLSGREVEQDGQQHHKDLEEEIASASRVCEGRASLPKKYRCKACWARVTSSAGSWPRRESTKTRASSSAAW